MVDAQAERHGRLAFVCTSDQAATERLQFSDIAKRSSKYALALQCAGLKASDRVLVQLPCISAWHTAMTDSTKLGLVPVPCIGMLTAKYVLHRIAHYDAKGVITTPDQPSITRMPKA